MIIYDRMVDHHSTGDLIVDSHFPQIFVCLPNDDGVNQLDMIWVCLKIG